MWFSNIKNSVFFKEAALSFEMARMQAKFIFGQSCIVTFLLFDMVYRY